MQDWLRCIRAADLKTPDANIKCIRFRGKNLLLLYLLQQNLIAGAQAIKEYME